MGNQKKPQDSVKNESNIAVDKIRDILFGTQMESYDQHFQHLETMIVAQARKSVDEMTAQLQLLETSFNQRIEKTEQTLELEREHRVESFSKIKDAQQQFFRELNDELQKLGSASTEEISGFKSLLEQQNHSLSSKIQALQDEFNHSLTAETSRLDKETVNRQQLADLLAKLSQRLEQG